MSREMYDLEQRLKFLEEVYDEALDTFGIDGLIIARIADQMNNVLEQIDELKEKESMSK